MQVTLERGGGVTGGRNHQRLGPLDTEARDDGTTIENLVAVAGFFEMDDDFPRTRGRSDPTWHAVGVVDGDADRTIRWDDNHQIPDPLKALWGSCSSLAEWEPVQ